jgi:NAD(P)-dependent dehydrogenase (short-subunit alcohol dehydrogenase family)
VATTGAGYEEQRPSEICPFGSVFDVNVRGTFFLVAALAHMVAATGGGSIVNITTVAAEVGMPGAAASDRTDPHLGSRIRCGHRAVVCVALSS